MTNIDFTDDELEAVIEYATKSNAQSSDIIMKCRNALNPISEHMEEFDEIFNRLSGDEKLDVNETDLSNALKRNGFTKEAVKDVIRNAMINGRIYERRAGWYAKA